MVKRRRSKDTKRLTKRRKPSSSHIEEQKRRHLKEGRLDAKKNFEEERDAYLERCPKSNKDKFGQIGFSKWGGKYYFPFLFVSPYHVPENPMRRDWISMLEEFEATDRLKSMEYLVYWYGSTNLNKCYGFLQEKQLKTYEWGVKNNHHQLPTAIKKKLESGKKLTKDQSELVSALQEMEEDIEKEPTERRRGHVDIKEYYEKLTMDDVDELGLFTTQSSSSENEESDDEEEETVKAKKREKKSEKKGTDNEEDNLKGIEVGHASATTTHEVEFTGDAEIDSEPEGKDADEEYIAGKLSSDEEDDDIYKQPGDRKSKKRRKSELPKKRTSVKNSEFGEKQNRLVIDDWNSAIQAENVDALQKHLEELSAVVENFSANFIKEHLPPLMKPTKTLLKRKSNTFDLGKLKKRIQEVYDKKIKKDVKKPSKFKEPGEGGNSALAASEPAHEEKIRKQTKRVSEPRRPNELKNSATKADKSKQLLKSKKGENDIVSSEQSKAVPFEYKSFDKTVSNAKKGQEDFHREKDNPPGSPGRRILEGPREVVKPKREFKLKPDRKKFTLSSFMAPKETHAPESGERKFPVAGKQQKLTPSWVTGSPSVVAPKAVERVFALDFLRQMASHFPAGKINVESVALSIEAAIFDWASKISNRNANEEEWIDNYWEKVHAIVASVCGKRQHGTLMHHIMAGAFTEPKELVLLSKEKLSDSFEGRAVEGM